MPYTAMQQLDLIKANKIKLINKLNTLLGKDSGLTWDSPWADILTVIRSIKTLLPEENHEIISEMEKFLANNSIGEVTINSDEIVPYAFYQKNTITSLVGPNVKTVGTHAFYNTSQLVSINLPIAETVKAAAFYNTKLSELNLPNVTLIEDKGFQNNTVLTSINLPKLTRTNVEAFRDCSSLSSIDTPNLIYISAHSFQNTKIKLKDIPITNLTYLGSYALASCSKLNEDLNSIEILPQNNLTIDTYCFQNSNLSKDVFIGNKVTSIGGYAFSNCGSNTKFWCEAPSKPSGWDSNWNSSNYPVNWGCIEKEYTFVKNNGEEDLVITKRYLTNDDFPVIERDGYQLDSWYTDEAFTHEISTPYYSKVNSTESTTIYARWIRGFNLKAINIEDNFSETDLGTYYFNNISDFNDHINGFNCVGYYENYSTQIFSNVVSDLDSISGLVPTLYIKATYLITKTEVHDFDYTGTVAEMVAEPGEHKLECWGAQGGNNTSTGGRGGYSVGTLTVTGQNVNLYVYVGGAGSKSATASGGGFNGGTGTNNYGGCGGGASDVRLGTDSLYSRLIVAGGGGGAGHASTIGGAGGGSAGLDGGAGSTLPGRGGGQVAGGTAASSSLYGKFGLGGANNSNGGGAGGGWYGGGHGNGSGTDSGGGGGSGWVYTKNSYENWANNSTEGQSGNWQLNNTDYLTEASTSAGNVEFLSPEGVSEVGHSGNGYIRITSTIKGEQESDFHGCTVTIKGVVDNEIIDLTTIVLMHNIYANNLPNKYSNYELNGYYIDEELEQPLSFPYEIPLSENLVIYAKLVNRADPLPEEYQHLMYIQGNTNAWINTNVIANTSTKPKIEFVMRYPTVVNDTGLFQTDWAANAFMLEPKASNSTTQLEIRNHTTAASEVSTYMNPYVGIKHRLTVSYDGSLSLVSEDGQTYSQSNSAMTSTSTTPLSLFRCTYNNTYLNAEIYSVKIWQDTTLIRYYIPCKEISTNKIGLYDLINQEFVESSGSGSFIAGPEAVFSLDTSEHSPKNLFDGNWTIGYYISSGAIGNTTDGIRGVNYIPVTPNTTYYSCYTAALYIQEYDSNKTHVNGSGVAQGSYTTGSNTYFLRFNPLSSYGQRYLNNINWTIGQRYTYEETNDNRIYIDFNDLEQEN